MPEQLDLTTPIVPPSRTSCVMTLLTLDWTASAIVARVNFSDGFEQMVYYNGPVALTLMRQLNKANLTIKSLQRLAIERFVLDGKLPAGSVSGAPD
jgi:hypothetical protein